MATPTLPIRRLLAAGLIKGSAWGTAIALGAGGGVLVLEGAGLDRSQPYLPAEEMDTDFPFEGDLGLIDPVSFTIPFHVRYDGGRLWTAIAGFFGIAGVPVSNLIATVPKSYTHTLAWANEIVGNFITYAEEFPNQIYEVASAKVKAVEITVDGGLIRGSIECVGNTLINTSAINTLTQMDALTYVDRGNRVKFSQGSVKINAQAGADVSAETALASLASFTIRFERPSDEVPGLGSQTIQEGIDGPSPVVTVSLSFNRMNATNDDLFATMIAETEQKMAVSFTGALIEGTLYYGLAFNFPRMRVIKATPISDQVTRFEASFRAEQAVTAPTGMTLTLPYIVLSNLATADYLA
uniref:Tail protein n=1 Tax=viral metagenome TaxID=1070528 RepID=A0A6H1ZFZ1_9ZZZZ